MSNRIEIYPNWEKLKLALNEIAYHTIFQAWIDKKIPQYSLAILERWADIYPNTIKALNPSSLMALALPQVEMELEALESKEADKMREEGIGDMEILQMAEINPVYFIAVEPKTHSPLFREMMELDIQETQNNNEKNTEIFLAKKGNVNVLENKQPTLFDNEENNKEVLGDFWSMCGILTGAYHPTKSAKELKREKLDQDLKEGRM